MPPTYRERLRVEGAVLAAAGAAGTVLLLATTDEAARLPLNSAGQLAVVAGLLAWLGPRGARGAMVRARPLGPDESVSGEPTPLWQHPLIVGGLTVVVGLPGGWDAGLRVTAGCLLVGAAQALVLERVVAADEARTGRRYVRLPGSRILRGTKLGFMRHERA